MVDPEAATYTEPRTAVVEANGVSATPLFEHYAERTITYMGITAPLGALINLCPVPKDQMEPGKIESWTANILTQAGVEIPQELMPVPLEDKKKVI